MARVEETGSFPRRDQWRRLPVRAGRGCRRYWRAWPRTIQTSMNALLVSTLVVAIAEIGDKTQLLAIILATRFKKPIPIILGILVATLANHALAATAGYWVADFLNGAAFKWAIAVSFIAM